MYGTRSGENENVASVEVGERREVDERDEPLREEFGCKERLRKE